MTVCGLGVRSMSVANIRLQLAKCPQVASCGYSIRHGAHLSRSTHFVEAFQSRGR